MSDRALHRIGSASAIIGAVVAVITNVLHPRVSDYSSPEVLLQAIAGSSIWVADHLGLIVGTLLILAGLVALSRSITGEPAAAVARLAVVAAVVSAAMGLVLLGIDGIVAKQTAVAWAAAPAAEKAPALRVAVAVEDIAFALFSLLIVLQFGVTLFLYGLAVALSDAYPRWLGWLAVAVAAGSAVVGLAQATNGPSVLVTNILFPILSSIAILWVLVMGVLLGRKAVVTTA